MSLLRKCPIPNWCDKSWHFGPSSQESCRRQQDALNAEAVVPAETWQQRREREEAERAAVARAAAIAAHQHIPPPIAHQDLAVDRNGER